MSGHEQTRFGRIAANLDALGEEYRPGMSPTELGEWSCELHRLSNRIDGLLAVTVAEADHAGTPLDSRQRTMAQVLGSKLHSDPSVTRAHSLLGTWISEFPQLADALVSGKLSPEHANHVRKMDNVRVHHALLRDQHLVLEWVRDFEWPDFKDTAAYWLQVNDQDGAEPEDHDPKNVVNIRKQPDGRVKGNFNLDPVSGAALLQQVGDEENALLNSDNECGVPRTNAQRRAQAFVNLFQRGAGRSHTQAKPLIHVVMSLKVLMHTIEQLAKDPQDQDFTSILDRNDVDGRCELIDGTPIHPKYALLLMMQARIRRQVLSAKNVTLEASYPTDAFPDCLRHIRLVESRGKCVTAGCDAPHTWLQADHRMPRSKQGETTLDNLDPLCRPDNVSKSDGDPLQQRDI